MPGFPISVRKSNNWFNLVVLMRRSAIYSLLKKGSGLVPEGWHAASGSEACALRGYSTAAKPITATLFPGDGVFVLCYLFSSELMGNAFQR